MANFEYDYKHLDEEQVKTIVFTYANAEQQEEFLKIAFASVPKLKMEVQYDKNGEPVKAIHKKGKNAGKEYIKKKGVKSTTETHNPFNIRRAINWIMENLYGKVEGLVITNYNSTEKETLTRNNFFKNVKTEAQLAEDKEKKEQEKANINA